jgi:large subunit ribosomal protein L29
MKTKEYRKKTVSELEKMAREDRAKLQQLRFDLGSGKVKNVREIRSIRKGIARILTILKQRNQ